MEAYCPRCKKSAEQPEDVVARGECPTCGGQLSVRGADTDEGPGGAFAMTFNAGSNVGVPIPANHEQQPNGTHAGGDPGQPFGTSPDLFASSDLPDPAGARAPGDSPVAPDEGAQSAPGLAGAGGPDVDGFPEPSLGASSEAAGAPEPSGAAGAGEQQATTGAEEAAGGEESRAEGEAVEQRTAESPGAPAGLHLQLPSIDFSMPGLGTITPSTSSGKVPSGDLPAHLQLPSFPEFELPPIPGQEPKEPAGSAAQDAAAPAPATQQPAGAPEQAGTAAPPPALPPPPPLKARRKKAPPQPAGGFGDLPEIALPKITAPSAREPTLLGSDATADIAIATRRSVLPVILLVLVVLAAGGVGGAFLYYGPSTVIGWFSPQKAPVVQKTKRERADELVIRANKAYRSKKYKQSIELLTEAVDIDPTHSEAHRTLGIAYAKTGQQAKAVEHYRQYLTLSPNAEDAATVRKYVDDYEKAQAQKTPPKAAEKRDRRRRRRR